LRPLGQLEWPPALWGAPDPLPLPELARSLEPLELCLFCNTWPSAVFCCGSRPSLSFTSDGSGGRRSPVESMRSGKDRVRPKERLEPMRSDMLKLRSRDLEELLAVKVLVDCVLTAALGLALVVVGLAPAIIGVLTPTAAVDVADHFNDSSKPPKVLMSDMVKSVAVDWKGLKPVEVVDPLRCGGGATL